MLAYHLKGATPMSKAAKTRGSVWFLALTVIILGWYAVFGGLLAIDTGVSAVGQRQ
jgi:hypothetical protein